MSEPIGVIDPEIAGTFFAPPPLVDVLPAPRIAVVDVRKIRPVDHDAGLPRYRCAFCGNLTFVGVQDVEGLIFPPWCPRPACVEWGAMVTSRWPCA